MMRWILNQSSDMPAGTAELRSDQSDLDPGSVELCISEQQPGGGFRHLDPRDSGQPWGTQEFWQRPVAAERQGTGLRLRSEEHTSELQSLMRISYAVFCLKKKKREKISHSNNNDTQPILHTITNKA